MSDYNFWVRFEIWCIKTETVWNNMKWVIFYEKYFFVISSIIKSVVMSEKHWKIWGKENQKFLKKLQFFKIITYYCLNFCGHFYSSEKWIYIFNNLIFQVIIFEKLKKKSIRKKNFGPSQDSCQAPLVLWEIGSCSHLNRNQNWNR